MNVFELIKDKLEEKKVCGGMRALTYNQGLCDAIDSVDEVAQEYNNGWIACSERLPEVYDNVLVCTEDGGRTIAHTTFNQPFCFFDMSDIEVDGGVIAWQPLPTPYKEGGM